MLVIHQDGYLINVVLYAVQRIGRIVNGQLLAAVDIRLLRRVKYQIAGLDSFGGGSNDVRPSSSVFQLGPTY